MGQKCKKIISFIKDVCFYEQRERRGKMVSIRQGCQQDQACQNQWKQNTNAASHRMKMHSACRFVLELKILKN